MPTRLSRFPERHQHESYEGRVTLNDHWGGHGGEFPEYANANAYLRGAIEFCRAETTRRFIYRRDGRTTIGYVNREAGTFAASSVNGEVIVTYFRPGPQGIDAVLRSCRMPENEGNPRTMPPGTEPRHATPFRQS